MTSKCEVCTESLARYKCPGCLVQTCSVPCVKKHKEETECTGRRDRTAFVPLRDFGDLNLLSDYRFLEEAHRKTDSVQNDPIKHQNRMNNCVKNPLPQIARHKDVKLQLMPKYFTRSQKNRSYHEKKSGTIHWHLELNFPRVEAQYEDVFCEKLKLKKVLERFIHPAESDPVIRQKFQMYTPRWPEVFVFMKAEKCPQGSNRYHEFNLDKTLQQNLKKKCVIEYPILYVVLEDEATKYRTEINPCAKSDLKRSSEVTSDVNIKKEKVVGKSDDAIMGDKDEQPEDEVTSNDRKDQLADGVTHTNLTEQPSSDITNVNESKQVLNENKSGGRNDAVTSDVRGKEWWSENY